MTGEQSRLPDMPRLAAMVAALRFYADPANWTAGDATYSPAEVDHGERARAALKGTS